MQHLEGWEKGAKSSDSFGSGPHTEAVWEEFSPEGTLAPMYNS